jgi:AcrR family transcriptional regulator
LTDCFGQVTFAALDNVLGACLIRPVVPGLVPGAHREGRRNAVPAQERAVATREKLLDAAITCLADFGYSGTTTHRVAQIAGTSRGAQLYHFPSKEDLLTVAVEHLALRRFSEIEARALQLQTPSQSGLVASTLQVLELLWDVTFSPPLFPAAMELWQAGRTDPILQARVHLVERSLGHRVHELLVKILPRKVTSDPKFDERFDTVTYMMRGLALTHLLKEHPAEDKRIIAFCAKLLVGQVREQIQ